MKASFAFLFLLGFPCLARSEEPLLPPVGNEELNLKVWGWTWSTYNFEEDEGSALAMWRVRAAVETDTPFSIFVEADLTEGFEEENWLRQAVITYKPSDDWEVSAGRLFLAVPRTTPPPFLLKTARFMRFPSAVFGWGVQLRATPNDWNIMADIAGDTRSNFDDGDQFDTITSTMRVQYRLVDELTVGGAFQLAEERNLVAGNFIWTPTEETLLETVAYTTHGDLVTVGGYLFGSYHRQGWPEIHMMLDYQEAAKDELLKTVGIRFALFNRIGLIVDHEFERQETTARLQFEY